MRADLDEVAGGGGGDLGLASASEEAGGCRAVWMAALAPPPSGLAMVAYGCPRLVA